MTNAESEGGNITPSVVSFTGKNSYEVGRNAKKCLGLMIIHFLSLKEHGNF